VRRRARRSRHGSVALGFRAGGNRRLILILVVFLFVVLDVIDRDDLGDLDPDVDDVGRLLLILCLVLDHDLGSGQLAVFGGQGRFVWAQWRRSEGPSIRG